MPAETEQSVESESTKEPDPTRTGKSIPKQLLALNATFAWSAVLALYIAIRLLVVAQFNTSSALTILSEGGAATTIVGSLISLVPALPPIAMLFSLSYFEHRVANGRPSVEAWFAVIISGTTVFFLSPWIIALPLLLYVLAIVVPSVLPSSIKAKLQSRLASILRSRIAAKLPSRLTSSLQSRLNAVNQKGGGQAFRIEDFGFPALLVLLALAISVVVAPPWFAQENLLIKGAAAQHTAFVIASDDNWTITLDPQGQVSYFRTSAVRAAQL